MAEKTESVIQIEISQGYVAFIDAADLPLVGSRRWSAKIDKFTCYARTSIGNKTVSMHRLIMGARPGDIVDHIDRNGLNNTRANLRFVTHGHNNANSVRVNKYGYRGISFDRRCPRKPWKAMLRYNGVNRHFGNHATKEEAALAHDRAMFEIRKDTNLLNFPEQFRALDEATHDR